MRWDIEERTEDALSAYLRANVTGDMRVYSAWESESPQFPCASVFVESTDPVSPDAEWHDARSLVVLVAIMTEASPEVDGSGDTIRTARELNADARSDVLNALCVSDLNERLINQGVASIAFSKAQLESTARSVEDRVFITTATLDIIAEPVTGS